MQRGEFTNGQVSKLTLSGIELCKQNLHYSSLKIPTSPNSTS